MRSRNLATISLAVMACGFIITLFLPESLAVSLLRGGFEAGLVGGIADWFAVTALFRHPLGLPIPHTSLLLKNRDKIIQSLISAMENELLNKESIGKKLRSVRIVSMGSAMLTRLLSRKKARSEALGQLIGLAERLPLEQAVPVIQSSMSAYIRQIDIQAAADTVLTRIMNDGKEIAAFDYVLEQAASWSGKPETRSMLGSLALAKLSEVKLGGFKGMAFQAFVGFVDEAMLGDMLQGMLVSGIQDLREEDNPHRESILQELRIAAFQFIHNESRMDKLKAWALDELQGDAASVFIGARLEELRAKALDWLKEEQASGGRRSFKLYAMLTRRISKESAWTEAWEERLRASLITFVENNHYRLGQLVKENLDAMDDASLVSMLEEKVGKDLQWIRVNGALCGFIVGLVLTVIQLF